MSRGGQLGHLVRRFVGSWSRRPVPEADLAWVRSSLTDAEWSLWQRLGPADRRHTIEVSRRAVVRLGADGAPIDRAFVAGALLHDIGKLDAGLGTFGRVAATLVGRLRGPAAAEGSGRVARYLRHEELGAERCRAIGSDPRTVALVGRHSTAPAAWLATLGAADDSI